MSPTPSPTPPPLPPKPPSKFRLKDFLRWAILGVALAFLARTLQQHWQEVAAIRIGQAGWGWLAIAFLITLLAHVWTGWVWGWILRELNQPAVAGWAIRTYLKTNIAKYLPGNVWHLYGRVQASQTAGFTTGAATLSVLLEPLLMAAAALMVALAGIHQANWCIQALSLVVVLVGVSPSVLNSVLRILGKAKASKPPVSASPEADTEGNPLPVSPIPLQIKRYPLRPLLGELVFLLLRGVGFLWIVIVFQPLQLSQVQPIVGAFSFAWLLGLVVPGAPGGIGVFEATAIALLQSQLPPAIILSTVALYRLVSTLAEAIGAGLAWGVERIGSVKS